MPKLYTKQMTYGLNQPLINVPFAPIKSKSSDPSVNDRYEVGQLWLNMLLNTAWILTSYTAGVPIWTEIDNGVVPGLVIWTTEAGPVIQTVPDHGYILTNGGIVTLTLPVIAPVGSQIQLISQGATTWTIAQNAGQSITAGGLTSTVGVTGGITDLGPNQNILLVTRVANTGFQAVSFNGNINVI